MKNKSVNIIFKTIAFALFLSALITLASTSVFAASVKLSSSAVKLSKGDTVSNTLTITLNKNEVEILKDSITVTLDGAEWNNYSSEGNITAGVTYKKVSDTQIEIHIEPTEKMLEKGCTIPVPLKCTITSNQGEISATTSYGIDGYTDNRQVFARCNYTRAYLSGKVIERKKGEEVYSSKNTKTTYNNLIIYVVGDDILKTKNGITVTLEGMTWSRYSKSGSVKNNAQISTLYTKVDANTIKVYPTSVTDHMLYSSYTMTIPLAGTITGTGALKATVNFGTDDIEESVVTFGYCSDGDITLTASSNNQIGSIGTVGDIVINDTTTQEFKKNTKFTVTLQQSYYFYQVPTVVGTGKYEDKCSVALTKDNTKQCVITMTDIIDSGSTGTITLKDVVIERTSQTEFKSQDITAVLAATGWEDYESTAVIATYSKDTEYNPPLRIATSNANAGAKEYSRLGNITFSDSGSDRNYAVNEKIVMTFDNDFYWFTDGAEPKLTTTGKFADACIFKFNTENKNEAYIVFTKNITSQSAGTIVISGIQVQRDSSDYFEFLNMTAYIDSSPATTNTIQVGKYSPTLTGELTSTTTTTTTEATTEATTESADESEASDENSDGNAVVKFVIGDISYFINGSELELNSAPYIKDGYTMLPIRVLANLTGISDDGISYEDGTATFSVGGVPMLIISAGEPTFTVNGTEKDLSTTAEIQNGTMFLPMRDLINALGISDENIGFDAETKTVTITVSK
ncbi:MAG: copper amine oxidase N-terminal domain-containing protein [Clostridiales bacterium]|nr:copper amine oxidase N-terminal domain-containing protein [Clostridiales bacterium]